MDMVEKCVPPPGEAERRTAVKSALAHMNSVGLTGVGDAGVDAKGIALYQGLDAEGALTVRVYAMIGDVGADFNAVSKAGPAIAAGDSRLTVRAVKLFADGALGSRGAALLTSYSMQPINTAYCSPPTRRCNVRSRSP